ncbi:alpha/beta hydrolase [Amycolatopsis roodepoortensis]|uniref:alpha/beta fold hydrolase n=1 Tax=Amycolatopsis roodepoortensis TaxID=700274 RepID=UPI00214AF2A6|nr:alpha/beta hydrolase [Amycolatopsis roodepoortensis]UUV28487.1 alpha/beta hydrolase [Amycolatopsis roodepoortensis]
MTTFVLIHGGGGSAWDFHLLEAELTGRGHDVVAVNLPIDDEKAGFPEHVDAVVNAAGDREDLVVLGHSYGGFTAPIAAGKLSARLLVMLTPMIPKPGETPGDWWGNTGFEDAEGLTDEEKFYNGVPADIVAEAGSHGRNQVSAEWGQPWPLDAWPDVPTKVLIGRDDRFFTPEFQRRVVQDRLGFAPDEIDGPHSVPLSHPKELADRLESYLTSDPAA